MEGFLRLIVLLIIFIFVLFITKWTTRYIANIQGVRMHKGNISVIEGQKLGANKNIYIVKIGEDYYGLVAGKDNVSVIDKLDSSKLNLPGEDPGVNDGKTNISGNFEHILEKFKTKKQDKK